MKKLFFSLLILSSHFINSANGKNNINNNEELQSSRKQKLSSSFHDFDTQNFNQEFDSLDNIIARNKRRRGKLNEWRVLKGLAGLFIGTKCFLAGSIGTIILLIIPNAPPSNNKSIPTDLSLIKNLIARRFLWLSLFGSLTAFSLWLLKRSVANIHYGFNGAENNIEYGDKY